MFNSASPAFEDAGFMLANKRNHWSAISPDLSKVALTVWSDEIDKTVDPRTYGSIPALKWDIWKSSPGNGARIKHIKHGIEHCDGKFELILYHVENPDVHPRKIKRADHWNARLGFIKPENFDEKTGKFLMTLAVR